MQGSYEGDPRENFGDKDGAEILCRRRIEQLCRLPQHTSLVSTASARTLKTALGANLFGSTILQDQQWEPKRINLLPAPNGLCHIHDYPLVLIIRLFSLPSC
jgi:hypothetical protein